MATDTKIKMFYIYVDEAEIHVVVIRMLSTGKWFAVGKMPAADGEPVRRSVAVYDGFEETLLDAARQCTLLGQGYYEV